MKFRRTRSSASTLKPWRFDAPQRVIWLRFSVALLIGGLGGALFAIASLPLAWMLGAMFLTGSAAILGLPLAAPRGARPPMSALIGTMLGAQFTPETLEALANWWPALLALVFYLVIAATSCYLFLTRVVKLDPVTGYFSAMPGGLIDMVLLGNERGGDERTIALLHSLRIFFVVFMLPLLISAMTGSVVTTNDAAYSPVSAIGVREFLFVLATLIVGVVGGRLIGLPAPFLIGPMLVSGTLHATSATSFVVPTVAIALAQIVLGTTVGCRFAGTSPRRIIHLMLVGAGSTAILLCISLLFAAGLPKITGLTSTAVLLAFSPGGLAEMSLIALSLQVEVVFVTISHMCRIALVIAGASVFFGNFHKTSP